MPVGCFRPPNWNSWVTFFQLANVTAQYASHGGGCAARKADAPKYLCDLVPALARKRDARPQMLSYSSEFGLTPSAQSKVSVVVGPALEEGIAPRIFD
ncbi:MAG: hypothetical protein DWH80_08010 [Planctomycetota bacterium]|nr:MAG: hypothetical protein DWH80_08010 [Planctomycetota bacterium]